MPLITQAEFARMRGFSRQYINKLVNQGRIKLVNGMVDSDATFATVATVTGTQANVSGSVISDQRNFNFPQYADESIYKKAENLNELLARVRLKNEIERGKILEAKAKAEIYKLASTAKTRKTATAKAKIVKDKVLDVVDRMSVMLAAINDTSQIREILTKELRNAMDETDEDIDVEDPY